MEAQAIVNRRKRREFLNKLRKHNNRKIGNSRRIQFVYDKPEKIFVERYITDHMLEKAIRLGMSKKLALEIYGKNRYRKNNDLKVTKVIIHSN